VKIRSVCEGTNYQPLLFDFVFNNPGKTASDI
jgi:hypothetical protein